jgi:hypothetical protein
VNGDSISDGTIAGVGSSEADGLAHTDDFPCFSDATGPFGDTSDSSGFAKGDFASAPNVAAFGGTSTSAAGSASLDTGAEANFGEASATLDADFSATGNGAFAEDGRPL